MISPATALRLQRALKKAAANHPKFIQFLNSLGKSDIPEGTVVEITISRPGKKPVTANIKVQKEDLDLINCLKEINL